jgi:hypothetical protein
MKPKKLSKKLTLNKSTVVDLNGNELKKVKGGICKDTNRPSNCHIHTASACPCPSEIISFCCEVPH